MISCNTHNKKLAAQGFIALMSVLIISLTLLGVSFTRSNNGFFSRFGILDSEYKRIGLGLAESCINTALLKISQNYNYNYLTDPAYNATKGGVVVSINPSGTPPTECIIKSITYGTEDANHQKVATITSQAEYKGTWSNTKVSAVIQNPNFALVVRGTITVITHVVNDNGGINQAGDFTSSVSPIGLNPNPSSFSGSETGTIVYISAGSYAVTSTNISGYTQTLSAECSGVIAPTDHKICTITQNDIPTKGTITVIANVINDNSGTKQPNDFQLYIDGIPTASGVPMNNLSVGAHTVSSNPMSGYSASTWGYHCASGGGISLSAGDNKTCIITFDDTPPMAPVCAETVMMLDRTGSMSSTDLADEGTAANSLISLFSTVSPLPKVGVGVFGDGSDNNGLAPARIVGQLTTTYNTLTSAINTWLSSSEGYTNLSDAITKGSAELQSIRHIPGKAQVLILVSDGDSNRPNGSTASSTSFMFPTADIQNGSGDSWTNPAGAYANSGTDASNNGGNRHRFYNFNLPVIPTGTTITGIEAQVDAWSTVSASPSLATLSPTSLGSFDQWNANTGTEVSAVSSNNGDTSYIDTANQRQSFLFANAGIPAGATNILVTLHAVAEETNGTTGSFQFIAENGSNQIQSSNVTLSNSYSDYAWIIPNTPSGIPWSVTELNNWSTRFGVLNTSTNGSVPKITQLYIVISYTNQLDTNYTSPSAQVSDTGGNGNGFESNPSNAYSDGSGSATNSNNAGDRHRYYNYNFNIPTGATITGIEVRPDWWIDSTFGTNNVDIELSWNGGSTWTTKKNENNESTSDSNNKIVGSPTDTWGRTWSISDFSNSNFRTRITMNSSSGSRDFSLDWIPVRVYYTMSSPNITLSPTSLGSFDQWNANTGTEVSAVSSNNGDTSYIDTSVSNQTFALPGANIPAGGIINSVTIQAAARGTAGGATMQLVAENGTNQSIGTTIPLTTNYTLYTRVLTTNPLTGLPWTLAEVNAWTTRFGVRTTASSASPRVTQLSLIVDYTAPPASSGCQIGIDLSWNGTNGSPSWSSEKMVTLTGTETTSTVGSISDTWGHTWQPSEFSNTNLRARVRDIDPGLSCADSAITHLDALKLKVHFSTPNNPNDLALTAADTAKLSGIQIFTIHYGATSGRNLLAQLANGTTANNPHQSGSQNDLSGNVITGDTGLKSPTISSNPMQWTSPDNGFSSNNQYTTETTNAEKQGYGNFGLTVPSGSTIKGIEVALEGKSTDSSGCQIGVEVSSNNGQTFTNSSGNRISITSTNDTSYTIGGSTSLWGRTWLPGDIVDGKFVVRLENIKGSSCSNNSTLSVDQVRVRVHYSSIPENGDNDNFFISPTSADMANIFQSIGAKVCPALSVTPTPPPTTANIIIITNIQNDNGGILTAGDFTSLVTATNPVPVGTPAGSYTGSVAPGTNITVDPGSFSIDQTSVSGYTKNLGVNCTGVISAGETKTCTITNDDIQTVSVTPPPPPPLTNIIIHTWQESTTSP